MVTEALAMVAYVDKPPTRVIPAHGLLLDLQKVVLPIPSSQLAGRWPWRSVEIALALTLAEE